MFEGLRPVTLYRIVVQAENGVSRKDGRVHLRQVVMDVATDEGGQYLYTYQEFMAILIVFILYV